MHLTSDYMSLEVREGQRFGKLFMAKLLNSCASSLWGGWQPGKSMAPERVPQWKPVLNLNKPSSERRSCFHDNAVMRDKIPLKVSRVHTIFIISWV